MGRGPVGKTAVVAAKDRETKQVVAKVIDRTDAETLQGFVGDHAAPDATLYTDDATAYKGSGREHETVNKHLQRYVSEFAGRQNIRELDTLSQLQHVVAARVGKRLTYRDLIANTGKSPVAN